MNKLVEKYWVYIAIFSAWLLSGVFVVYYDFLNSHDIADINVFRAIFHTMFFMVWLFAGKFVSNNPPTTSTEE